MPTRCLAFRFSWLLFLTLSNPTLAQTGMCPELLAPGVPCCGQYECMEPLLSAEVGTSRSDPQMAPHEPEAIRPIPRISDTVLAGGASRRPGDPSKGSLVP